MSIKNTTECKVETVPYESEDFLSGILDDMTTFVSVLRPRGEIIFANNTSLKLIAKSLEDVKGMMFYNVEYWTFSKKAMQSVRDDIELCASGEILSREFQIQTNKGFMWVEGSMHPIYDEKGDVKYILAEGMDITQRKQAEIALRESKEKYRDLVERANDGITIIQDGILKYANPRLAKMWGGRVEEIIGTLFTDYVHPTEISKVLDYYNRRMAGEDVPNIYETILRSKDGKKVYTELNTGLIAFNDEPSDLVIVRDITERKKTEIALRESEENFRAIAENSNDGIFIAAGEGHHVYVNKRAAEISGYSRQELLNKIISDLAHPDEREKLIERYKQRIKGKPVPSTYETLILRKDNKIVPIEITGSKTTWKDQPADIVIVRDITERKDIEAALQEREEFLSGTLNDMTTFVAILKLDGEIIFVNNTPLKLIDKSLEDVKGMMFYDAEWWTFSEETRQKLMQNIEICASGKQLKYETQVQTNNGPIWIDYTMHPIFDEKRKVKNLVAEGRDITERKKAEEIAETEKNKLNELTEKAPFGLALVNKDKTNEYINPKLKEILGYDLEDIPNEEEWFKKLFPDPEFREKVEWYWVNDIKDAKPGQLKQRTFPIITKDGRERILHFIPVLLENGCILMSIEDRTELIKAYQRIRDIEERQRKLLRESFDAVIIHVEGEIISINPKGAEILGAKSPEEIAGNILLNFIPSDYHEIVEKRIEKMISTGLSVPLMEMKFVKLDGEVIDVEIVSTAIKIGNKVGVQSVFRDITTRKNAEKQLKKSLKEKDALLREIHHRVKNNLQVISSLLNLQSQNLRDEYDLELFKESQNRVKSIALIHENLYQTQNFAGINMAEHIKNLVLGLCSAYHIYPGPIKLNANIQEIKLNIETAIPLSLIINELVTNSIKHAFPGGQDGEINIELVKTNEKSYKLTMSDNGVGFPEHLDMEKTETLGLRLVNILIKQLDGTIKLDTTGGAQFEIEFNELVYVKRD